MIDEIKAQYNILKALKNGENVRIYNGENYTVARTNYLFYVIRNDLFFLDRQKFNTIENILYIKGLDKLQEYHNAKFGRFITQKFQELTNNTASQFFDINKLDCFGMNCNFKIHNSVHYPILIFCKNDLIGGIMPTKMQHIYYKQKDYQ